MDCDIAFYTPKEITFEVDLQNDSPSITFKQAATCQNVRHFLTLVQICELKATLDIALMSLELKHLMRAGGPKTVDYGLDESKEPMSPTEIAIEKECQMADKRRDLDKFHDNDR